MSFFFDFDPINFDPIGSIFSNGQGRSAGRYPTGWYQYRHSNFDPRINRHTGKPHEHNREIARRQRQEASRG